MIHDHLALAEQSLTIGDVTWCRRFAIVDGKDAPGSQQRVRIGSTLKDDLIRRRWVRIVRWLKGDDETGIRGN